jgi:anaerobic magnesium-protoporphyrin IX monomethyl ester cyclase
MRVLLLRPPRRDRRDVSLAVPPLGLCYLAAALREAGFEVRILDARAEGLGCGGLGDRVRDARADLVGITAASPVADLAARAAAIARPHCRWLLLGGPHPTACGAAVFEAIPALDASIEGEAEISAPVALSWLAAGARGEPPPGLRLPGRPFSPAAPPHDLDALPAPARDLLPRRGYHHLLATRRPMTTALTSRGCPHACTFCDRAVGGARWRARSAEHVLAELEELAASGVRFVHFYDDNFTHDRARVMALCQGSIQRGLDLRWNCEARVDGVDPELLGAMRRAGCELVAFGVESAWEPSLQALGKGFDRAAVERAFSAARRAGLRTLAYVILGSPGEGPAQLDATLRFCQHLRADFVQFSTLSALPGSSLAEAGEGHDVRSFLDADRDRRVLTDLPPRELSRWLRRGWAGFYLRPRPLLRLSDAALRSGAWRSAPRLIGAAASWWWEGAR